MKNNYTEPNLKSSAIIIIDMQNDFVLPKAIAEIKGSYALQDNLVTLLNQARISRVPIIHVIRLYEEDGSNVDLCRKSVVQSGHKIVTPFSEGAEILDALTPPKTFLDFPLLLKGEFQQCGDQEWIMYKPRWGAFYKTDLETFLRERQVDTLIFGGCNFPNCPRTSIYEASERDFKIILARDAMSQLYAKGLEEMANIEVKLMSTAELVKAYQE
ncbi:isochorismatase family cysteine hydrolase [Desulfosporosinus sp. PR]|uniref:isochorismatase family cysteine hydrolase n=1 Tax=Candidatus Desulfosporosinus nitrosoreducens TaxID=3401928 RepID=UPI0027F7D5A5|nr:isochorismatase family cysteine hydrolase [Desulfosporosinus sp. PR]MDQ7097074.1 isochorismatase family cysteine hydrolase [Desulfosporosinus sp. PR]